MLGLVVIVTIRNMPQTKYTGLNPDCKRDVARSTSRRHVLISVA